MRTSLTTKVIVGAAAALSAVSVVGATAAQADGMQLGTTNIYEMGQAIDAALDGNVNGYGYAIAKDGKLVMSNGEGQARNSYEGNLDFTANTRVEIASSTKNIMAAAVLHALEKANVSVDARISGYLPFNWTNRGNGWGDVTFRMLLAHTSGLEQRGQALGEPAWWNTRWAGVQAAVSQPVTAPSPRLYSNMNYATLRILLPRLWKIAEPNNGQPSLNSTNSGQITLAYLNKFLLQPSGIAGVSCESTNTTALIYEGPNSQLAGADPALDGDSLEACAGHRGLNMSAVDLVRWQVHLRHGNVVSQSVRNLMDNTSGHAFGPLGWDRNANNGGAWTGRFWHGGDITTNGRGVHTCHIKFPGNIEAAVVVNSQSQNNDMCFVLRSAYNQMMS